MIKKTMTIMTAVVLAGSMSASAGLLAGFETWDSTSASGVNLDGVTATAAYAGWGRAANDGSNDGSWGSLTTPGANTANSLLNTGIILQNGANGSVTFTITDTTGVATDLSKFHFDGQAFRPNGARNWSLEVVAGGALTAGSVTNNTLGFAYSIDPDFQDIDVDLTGLTDSTLDANGSVTFQLTFSGGNGQSGHNVYLDNVGVSAVPEPATLGLVAMMGGGILLIRRRFMI